MQLDFPLKARIERSVTLASPNQGRSRGTACRALSRKKSHVHQCFSEGEIGPEQVMLSRSMSRSISIVGAGRVGRTFAKRLRKLGWKIGAVVTRSSATARAAVRAIGAGSPRAALTPHALDADVILLSTPDGALSGVARKLAVLGNEFGKMTSRNKIVLHTSGALDHRVLAPLARLGAHTGSMHPMQTFSGRATPLLNGVIFSIEGAPAAIKMARKIARSLGATPVLIDGKHKPAYHAAGAVVAGHALALVESATQTLMKIGFTRRCAAEALLPLIRQMLDNYERHGPHVAWTGPLSRGDYATISKHVKALRKFPREYQRAYEALAVLSTRVLSKQPAATKRKLSRALGKP
ncbi:MAG: Rossmann-like and DUF2520 domain-containing protein [Candidatus Acidiferrales bacterium]